MPLLTFVTVFTVTQHVLINYASVSLSKHFLFNHNVYRHLICL